MHAAFLRACTFQTPLFFASFLSFGLLYIFTLLQLQLFALILRCRLCFYFVFFFLVEKERNSVERLRHKLVLRPSLFIPVSRNARKWKRIFAYFVICFRKFFTFVNSSWLVLEEQREGEKNLQFMFKCWM